MNLTPQQAAFIEALRAGASSIVLEAVAGSGKTTTLVLGAQALNGTPTLACAFNKSIAETLQQRLPSNCTAKTMNGLGHGAWSRHLGGKRLMLEGLKFYNALREVHRGARLPEDFAPELKKLIDIMRSMGVVPQGAPGGPRRDDEQTVASIIEEHDIDLHRLKFDFVHELARKVLDKMIRQAWQGLIDFNDQLYMPVISKSPFRRFPRVLVDESQDLNQMQHEMLAMMLEHDGLLTAAGDRHQAIYGFRGADTRSMDNLLSAFSAQAMPLTVSFRCPQAVVREAQHYVSHIEASSEAPEGIVGRSKIADLQPGDVVLCRYNRPIVDLCFALLSKGIAARLLGRDMLKGLDALIKKFDAGLGTQELGAFAKQLSAWASEEISALLASQKDAKAGALDDKVNVLLSCAEHVGFKRTTADLRKQLDQLFSDTGGTITLSTIHKAKGLEWPRVHFLGIELIPSRWARQEWEKQQELNMAYVGVTRAQRELYYLTVKEAESV